jgi:pSer/pThr/pTyr-binding forkhead associated (FHA) protein
MARARPGLLAYRSPDGTEQQIELAQDEITIGRSETCTIVLPFSTVSRLHARIELQHNRYVLSDAGSANGTYLNGERIKHGHQLSTGDEVWMGTSTVALTFSDPDETMQVSLTSGPPPLFIDENGRVVQVYGMPVQLSTLEYDLLLYLAHHPRMVCTREECFLAVWGQPYDHATCEDALNACMARIRRNLRAGAQSVGQETPQITTIQRIGFRLDTDVAFAPRAERPRERALSA